MTLARHVSFVFMLAPRSTPVAALTQNAGARRKAYNTLLAMVKDHQERGEHFSWNAIQLQNTINKHKLTAPDWTWHKEVSKYSIELAAHDLADALQQWKDGLARFPRFKKKSKSTDRFTLRASNPGEIVLDSRQCRARLPKLGWVLLHRNSMLAKVARMIRKGRFRILKATISWNGKYWQVALAGLAADRHEQTQTKPRTPRSSVGVDQNVLERLVVGNKAQARTSSAEIKILDVLPTPSEERRLARLDQAISRAQYDPMKPPQLRSSNNRTKLLTKKQRLHKRISDRRTTRLHQATTELVKSHDRIVIEDLDVDAMVKKATSTLDAKNRIRVARSSFGMVAQQITYKAIWAGVELQQADRYYPSSQLCSQCGTRNPSLGSSPTFRCVNVACGYVGGRNHNAAGNLESAPAHVLTQLSPVAPVPPKRRRSPSRKASST